MDPVWLNFCSVLLVFTLAIISPGPNFVLVINTALSDSRRSGLYTALGVAIGSGLFALAGMLGLLLLIRSLPYFAVIARLLGGGYLCWIGFDMLRTARRPASGPATDPRQPRATPHPIVACRRGLLTNLTNPKAWAFYFSLFTLVMTPQTPLWAKVTLNLLMFAISFVWYATMAILITDHRVQPLFMRVRPWIQGLLGAILLWLGGRLLLHGGA